MPVPDRLAPIVSVIVPCLNEESTIDELIDALAGQSYADPLEIVIADGMSEDATRDRIDGARRRHPDLDLRVIDNPARNIPAGLNRAIAHSAGLYLVRVDAHCVPGPTYVERSVEALEAGLGDCVGGVIDVAPKNSHGPIARGIARAVRHPVGVGDAMYRIAREPAEVDTVPFGAFRRDLLVRLGGYDERLLANQDYELNARIRKSGGTVWLDPAIRSTYRPRGSLAALSRQYRRYGTWKVRMLRLGNLDTLRWRQVLPPAFVAGLIGLSVAAPFSRVARRLFALQVGGYATVLGGAGVASARDEGDPAASLAMPAAIAVMHLSWGAGFLAALLEGSGGARPQRRRVTGSRPRPPRPGSDVGSGRG